MSIATGPYSSTEVTDPTGSQVAPTDLTGDSVAKGKAPSAKMPLWRLLLRDPMATVAAAILVFVLLVAAFGPWLVGDAAYDQNLDESNLPPFNLDTGFMNILGTDPLGRSMLARLIVACRTTMLVAVPAVLISCVIGSVIGMWAGYHRGWRETTAMRIADVMMSFPSLLLAVVVLYVFSPSAANIVLVLAFTRIPIYLRTARAESAELQSRIFVDAARTFGASSGSIIRRHVLPILLPTLLTVATLDFCFVMLAESSLSFLGIGIQPPEISWGLMVSQGRTYLQTAWWLSFFPGLAIVVTTVAATVLAAWARIATDPGQRWRLTVPRKRRRMFSPRKAVA
ncbi:UNVERIFIED_CONTAM: peptide/nickel transport system permease protein [Williamsia faeni]